MGAVQALFEGAMYIFVLQWPPALKTALKAGVSVPFGTIFSCFMVGAGPHLPDSCAHIPLARAVGDTRRHLGILGDTLRSQRCSHALTAHFEQSEYAMPMSCDASLGTAQVCCMLGSTLFSALTRAGVQPEDTMAGMLGMATVAMLAAKTIGLGGAVVPLIAAFFAFEACVGMYFPLIGTLRSKLLPDAYRGVIMNLFGIPLNLIVVGVFLSIDRRA